MSMQMQGHLYTEVLHFTKNTIHQITTMLATSKNTVLPVHNQLLTTGTNDLSL